jgi:glycerol-3-phosphate acyltransferase PlsY
MSLIFVTLAAYLLGSLAFAVIVTRLMGLADPRSYGSKNPGMTNVLRGGNKLAAGLTLLLDALKGFAPVVLVKLYAQQLGIADEDLGVALVGLAAFLGHLYPVFFGFKGGKGVATALGVLLGIHWLLGLMALVSWLIVAVFSKYSSLASMVAVVAGVVFYLLFDRLVWYTAMPIALSIAVMAALLIYKHKDNISRLLKGTESKFGQKKT